MHVILLLVFIGFVLPSAAQVTSKDISLPETQNLQRSDMEKLFVHTDRSFYLSGSELWFSIYCFDAKSNLPLQLSRIAHVELATKEGKTIAKTSVELLQARGSGNMQIPAAMPSGTYLLRAFTRWMRNTEPELLFEKPVRVVNSTTPLPATMIGAKEDRKGDSQAGNAERLHTDIDKIESRSNSPQLQQVRTDKRIYGPREAVTLSISPQGDDSNSLYNLSVSVFLIDDLQELDHGNIQQWLSAGWRGTLSNHQTVLPEYEGQVFEARVSKPNGSPARGLPVQMSIPGNKFYFRTAITDSLGMVAFASPPLFESRELVLQTVGDTTVTIEIVNSKADQSVQDLQSFTLAKNLREQLELRHASQQIESAYSHLRSNVYEQPDFTDTSGFYGRPDLTYNLDDYTRFNTMEEVLREFVEDVRVRRSGDQYRISVRDDLTKLFFEEDPLILHDGIALNRINDLFAVDPLKLRQIQIVRKKVFQGNSVYHGIIVLKSYEAGEGIDLPVNALVADFSGVELRKQFESPDYATLEARKSRLPDFRTLLYWNPSIVQRKPSELTFYTSDVKARFGVVVQGFDQAGSPIHWSTTFRVE